MNLYYYVLIWVAVFLSALCPILIYSYRYTLGRKKGNFENIFRNDNVLRKYYTKVYLSNCNVGGGSETEKERNGDMQKVFDIIYFSRNSFLLPTLTLFSVTLLGFLYVLFTSILKSGAVVDIETIEINKLPTEIILAFIGSYVWGLHDILKRRQNTDLTPDSIHYVWLKIMVSVVLSFIIMKSDLGTHVKYLLSFSLGVFPVGFTRTILSDFSRKIIQKLLKVDGFKEKNNDVVGFSKLDGISPQVLRRFHDINITSVAQLAYSDPIKIFLRMNIGWKSLLDLIDQAFLSCYIEGKSADLRILGIRGGIDIGILYKQYRHQSDRIKRKRAKKVILKVAELIESDFDTTVYLIQTLHNDLQLQFLWELWDNTLGEIKEKHQDKFDIPENEENDLILDEVYPYNTILQEIGAPN
ncbi:MAG: hypothetical protein ACEPOV_01120 [Hyphomicrobiales bacterium]